MSDEKGLCPVCGWYMKWSPLSVESKEHMSSIHGTHRVLVAYGRCEGQDGRCDATAEITAAESVMRKYRPDLKMER